MTPEQYYSLGYTVLPISAGLKKPTITGWTELTPEILITCFNQGDGIGIRLGAIKALDIDIYCSSLSASILEYIDTLVGEQPYRVGQAPKLLIVFKCPDIINKITSKRYINPTDGTVNAIEVLASNGQQFITDHIHPDTGKPYTWHRGDIPAMTDVVNIDLWMVESIIKYFEDSAAALGWTEVVVSKSSNEQTPEQHNYNKIYNITELLTQYGWTATGDNQWIRPGKKHGIGGTVTGNTFYCFSSSTVLEENTNLRPYDLVLAYAFNGDVIAMDEHCNSAIVGSLSSAGFGVGVEVPVGASVESPVDRVMSELTALPYNGALIHPDQWFSIVSGAGLYPIDLDIILTTMGDDGRFEGGKRDIRNEYKLRVNMTKINDSGDLMNYMQTRFVYMRNGNRMVDLEKPPHAALMKVAEFNLAFKKKGTVFVENSDKPMLVVNAYFINDRYESVVDERFHPSKPVIYNDDESISWFNPAHFPKFRETLDETKLVYVKEHMNYLFPGGDQFTRFMDWLAWTVHEPATRIKFTPLLISRHHGTGRTWLTELVPKLLGEHNCTITEMKTLAGQGNEGTYHNYFYNSVFCAIQEVKVAGEDAFAVDDAIRSKLTDERMNLNLKYGTNGTYQVFVNFLMLTNHRDALVLTGDDRRMEVFEHFAKPESDEFYDKLYQCLEDRETMEQMFWYLHRWYVSRQGIFNPSKPALMSDAKKRMINTVTNDLGGAMNIVVNEYPADVITSKILKERILDHLLDVGGMDITAANEMIEGGAKHINMFCKKTFVQLIDGKKMKVDGVNVRVYAIKNEQQWLKAPNREIRDELKKNIIDRLLHHTVRK